MSTPAALNALIAVTVVALAGGVTAQRGGAGRVTFSEHVAPILYGNCVTCHRAGEEAPFPLITYDDVAKRAKLIAKVTQSRFMPPWHAVHGYGDFRDERGLTDAQIATIRDWVGAGWCEAPPRGCRRCRGSRTGGSSGSRISCWRCPTRFGARVWSRRLSQLRAADRPRGGRLGSRRGVPAGHAVGRAPRPLPIHPRRRGRVAREQGRPTGLRRSDAGRAGPGLRASWRDGAVVGRCDPACAARRPRVAAAQRVRPGVAVAPAPDREAGERAREGRDLLCEVSTRTEIREMGAPGLFGLLAGLDIPPGEKNFTITGTLTMPADMLALSVTAHAHYLGMPPARAWCRGRSCWRQTEPDFGVALAPALVHLPGHRFGEDVVVPGLDAGEYLRSRLRSHAAFGRSMRLVMSVSIGPGYAPWTLMPRLLSSPRRPRVKEWLRPLRPSIRPDRGCSQARRPRARSRSRRSCSPPRRERTRA